MNRTFWIRTLGLLMASALAVATQGCGGPGEPAETDDPEDLKPVSILAAKATVEPLQPSVAFVGKLMAIPEQSATVATQVVGVVSRVAVVDGDHVRMGDTLVVLDSRLYEVERDKAKAALAVARAGLRKLEHGTLPQEISAARSEAARVEAVVQGLRSKLEALKPLLEAGEVADVRYQQIEMELQASQEEAAAARARAGLLEAGTRAETIAEAEALVTEAEAELALRELSVEFCDLRSPIQGIVTGLPVRVGASLSPQTCVATVASHDALFARVRVPSAQAVMIDESRSADVEAIALPNRVFPGRVARMGPEADAQTGGVDTFVEVENGEGRLRPGLACSVRFWLAPVPDAVVIPDEAIADHDGRLVVTVIRDGLAYEEEVTVGARAGGHAQILDGVAEGELVATEGGYGLPDGYPVLIAGGSSLDEEK
jgi:multidrug efflux pump subunit AcrA (membrane-fusion protein)